MDWEQILAMLARLAELTAEELVELETALIAFGRELGAAEPSDEVLAQMDEAATALDQVSTRQAELTADAEARAARQADLAARFEGDDPAGDPDPAADPAPDPAADPEPDPEPAADPDPAGDPDPAADPADVDPAADPAPDPAAEPVAVAAAASRRAPAMPAIGRVAARTPASRRPRARANPDRRPAVIQAAAGTPGFAAGMELTRDQLAEAIVRRAEPLRNVAQGFSTEPITVATVRGTYPNNRMLLPNDIDHNMRVLRDEEESRIASGGLCAPLTPLYDVVGISDDARPLRSALPGYGLTRGGARWIPPPRLGDFSSGVAVWTEANDQNPSSPATKPCVRVECDDEDTVVMDAITKCLEVGNFFARTYDERVQAIIDLLNAEHARLAERTHLTTIAAGSTHVNLGQHLGAVRDLLAGLDLLLAGYENRWRKRESVGMTWMLPEWIHDICRADLVRELPGSNAERLATADAMIDEWIRMRGVTPVWLLEGEAGQDWTFQGVGPVNGWPSTAVTYLFHNGAWNFGDGGELNLGIVRDSTLNSTNDLQIWSETFEAVFFRGIESLRAEFDICPSGWTSAAVDLDPCSTGS
jgi:hypothetical protein